MSRRPIPSHELYRHFQCPKNWHPGQQSYFGRFRRIPRKLKKTAKRVRYEWLDLGQKLWHLQGERNPDLNRFLIKQITDTPNLCTDKTVRVNTMR